MPDKLEIKANKLEIREWKRKLSSKQLQIIKQVKAQRTIIQKAQHKIEVLSLQKDLFTSNVNRRIEVLEGRNNS